MMPVTIEEAEAALKAGEIDGHPLTVDQVGGRVWASVRNWRGGKDYRAWVHCAPRHLSNPVYAVQELMTGLCSLSAV